MHRSLQKKLKMEMNQPISSLNLPKTTMKDLQDKGFNYCEDLEGANSHYYQNAANYEAHSEIWNLAKKVPETRSALDLLNEENDFRRNYSYSPLDNGLDDVMKKCLLLPGRITELCGLPGSGKTQVCLHLCCGNPEGTLYICTNRNFSIDQLKEIMKKYKLDEMCKLQDFCYLEIDEMWELLAVPKFLDTQNKKVRLLIIDSITWLFRQNEVVSERTGILLKFVEDLRSLGNGHKFPIIFTNDLTTILGKDENNYYNTSFFGDSLFHCVNERILLTKGPKKIEAQFLKKDVGITHINFSCIKL